MLIPFGILGASGAGAAGAYELIQTISSTSTSITFNSLPTNYKHLQLRMSGFFSNNSINTFVMRFNGDTAANYTWHRLYAKGNLTGIDTQGALSQSSIEIGQAFGGTDESSPFIVDILDVFSATKNKTSRIFSGTINVNSTSETYLNLYSGLWLNTAPITSITLTTGGGATMANTIVSLYGIKG